MFNWLFRNKLQDVLNQTETVFIHRVKFRIRKINPLDYMAGSKAIRQIYETYQVASVGAVEINNNHAKELKAHYGDVFLAAVVEPELKRKKDDPGNGLPVEHLMTDWDFAVELYSKIMEFTYGKKKFRSFDLSKIAASKSI